MTSFNFNHIVIGLFPNTVTLRVKTLIYEFGGWDIIQSTAGCYLVVGLSWTCLPLSAPPSYRGPMKRHGDD